MDRWVDRRVDGWMDGLGWSESCVQVGFESSLSDSSF